MRQETAPPRPSHTRASGNAGVSQAKGGACHNGTCTAGRRLYWGMNAWCCIAIVLALVGCGNGLRDKVVGTWKFDQASVPAPQSPTATTPGWNITVAPKDVRISFRADGTMTVSGDGPERTAKWSLNDHNISIEGQNS